MKPKEFKFWDDLRSSFWFTPGVMVALAGVLALVCVEFDERVAVPQLAMFYLYTGSPAGAMTLLSTVAGSMIGVAGVVFSVTIVALTLASAQFGPRLLGAFMRDPVDQVALGTFLATFVYCLLVLRAIRDDPMTRFVPHFSITIGILLTLFSLAVLIYFIHHVSKSIQAANVIDSVGDDLDEVIERLFPPRGSADSVTPIDPEYAACLSQFEHDALEVRAAAAGYLQAIDYDGLLARAAQADLQVQILPIPGDYVSYAGLLARVRRPSGEKLDAQALNATAVAPAFVLGAERTHTQDVEFPIVQMVQLCLRALSPAINDPITAVMCIERLGEAMRRLADRELPSPCILDDRRVLRLLVRWPDHQRITRTAFNQIRQYGSSSLEVSLALVDALATIAERTCDPRYLQALLEQAELIERGSHAALPEERDRLRVRERFQTVADRCR